MGASLPIPRELADFLALPPPQSLLLRGPPGAGKTSLALALLQSFPGSRYFVTNRVPTDDVLRAFPWLGENRHHGIQVIDNTTPDSGFATAARALLREGPGVVSDAPSATRDLREFLWLPEPLQEAWSRINPERPSLVVLDSWDALVESYLADRGPSEEGGAPSRADVERSLLRRMGSARTHLLFVLEREEQTQLDYLVNGVAVASREVVDGRLERWLTLYKLRGVRIENALYPYSLESARFECIVPPKPYGEVMGGRYTPAPDRLPGFLWPGSRAFADAFGRLPLGRTSLLEVADDVPNQVPRVLLAPMLAETVELGGRVIVVPGSNSLPDDTWEAMHGAVERHRFLAQVRFLLPPAGPNEERSAFEPMIVRVGGPAEATPAPPSDDIGLDQFLRSGSTPDAPGLFVVSLQGLVSIATSLGVAMSPDMMVRLPAQIQQAVRGAPIHAIAVGPPSSPLLEPMRSSAALRLHLRQVQGRLFIHGSDPWTPKFVLTEGTDSAPYGLLRVV